MKHNLELMSALAGAMGALIKTLKSYKNIKNLILNVIVGFFIGFVVVQGVIYFVENKDFETSFIVALGWISGWLSNEIVEKFEDLLDVWYDMLVRKIKPKKDETSGDSTFPNRD